MGVGPVPATEKALAKAGPDHRRHRPVRAQRGVRRAGAGVPRPLRHRRRRPAGQPVRRRDRRRPPAGLVRRPADDPAGPAVRGAPRGPLRPHRHVHRPRHGRHRHLGEPALRRHGASTRDDRRPTSAPAPSRTRSSRTRPSATSTCRCGAGTARADHARQRPRPHQADHPRARPGWRRSTRRSTRCRRGRRRRDRRRRRHRQAVHLRGRRRPHRRPRARRPRATRSPSARLGHDVFRRLGELGVPDVRLRQRRGHGRRPRARPALHLPHPLRRRCRRSRCPRSSSAWSPAGAAPTCCRTCRRREAPSRSSSRTRSTRTGMLKAAQAFDLGIADALLRAAPTSSSESLRWAARRARAARSRSSGRRSTAATAWDAAVARGRAIADAQVHGAAPAPYRALDLIDAARTATRDEGFAAEDEALADLDHGRRAARPASTPSTWSSGGPSGRPARRTSRSPGRSPRSASSAPG